jgi:hypothetical protein
MDRAVSRFFVAAAFICGGFFAWKYFRQAPAKPVAVEQKTVPGPEIPESLESKLAHEMVTIRGPLADYMSNNKPSQEEGAQSAPRKPSLKDHIEDSPVGTSGSVLHKTFVITRVVHVPFEIPPHAVMPRFHGTFQSIVQGEASNDESTNVDLLLMNETQYAEFAAGDDPEVLYLADTSHHRDISVPLSPSRDQPVRYHLVFRSTPGGATRKVVAADFSVDF